MNFRTTVVLIVLAAGGAAVWLLGPAVAPRVGLMPKPIDPAGAGSPAVLDQRLTRDEVKRVEVQAAGEPVVLEKSAGGWALPGKWPTRKTEAEELVNLVTGLHSRFLVVPLASDSELDRYGLDPSQKPVTVTVEGEEKHTLRFGEPASDVAGPFARPTYVRVDDKPEVVRLAPDLLPVLRRPREAYQRRQLFPDTDRVKFDAAANAFGPATDAGGATLLPRAKAVSLEFTSAPKFDLNSPDPAAAPKKETLSLKKVADVVKPSTDLLPQKATPQQLAEAWEIIDPVHDRPEPDRLKALLAAIPELWVESFATGKTSLDTGLDKPERTLKVTLAGGDTVVLLIGRVSQTKTRPGVAAPPPRPGMPPLPPPAITEEYRYAMLEGQTQVFEIKADKFNDLFVSAASLRDEKLARFKPADVNKVEVKQGDVVISLEKEKDEKKGDKWHVRKPMQALAETEKITELLDKLAALEARDKDVIDKPNLKDAGFDPVARIGITLALEEEIPGSTDAKARRPRSVAFSFGKHDAMAKKLNVRVAGREQVSLVADDVLKLAERPPLAYRGRRVLDFDASAVASVEVQREKETFRLQQADGEWKLAAPVAAPADKTKASSLADDLSRLEAVEYVNDAPKPDDLIKAGLDKPLLTAKVAFSDAGKAAQVVQIGKQREGKPEFFARLATGPSIFVVKKEVRDKIDVNSLDFRPTQLWTFTPNDVTAVKVTRGADTYELKRDNFEWKVIKPFEAKANFGAVMPLLEAITTPKVSGYQAHTATNPAEFGLDKPVLQVTFTAAERPKEGEKEVAKEKTLLIGKAVDGKPEVYAKLADDPAIFKIADATRLNADKPALDLLDRQLLRLNAGKITKLQRTGAAAMTLTKDGKGWKAESGAVSFPADQPTVDATLRTWELLQAEKIADYGANVDVAKYGLNPPVDVLTVSLDGVAGKPETHTLKLGKTQGPGRYARIDDGPAVALLSAQAVTDLARTNLDFADRSLLNFEENDLQGIVRTMKGNDLELAKKNTWKIVKPVEQPADEPTLDDWSKQLAKLRADRVAAYAPADLKPFGLDAPAALVTLNLGEKDGKPVKQVLKLGAPADPKEPAGDRFAQIEGAKVVALLGRDVAKRLLADPVQFRDKTLVRRLAEPDKATLERGDRAGAGKVVFTKVEGTWKMTAPAAAEAEHADLEEYLNVLYKLRADEFVAEKPDAAKLKEYGLDKPTASWRFFVGDKEVLGLLIGKQDSTGQRSYAKLASGEMVFLLPPAATQRATAEYRKRSLWTGFDAAQVETLIATGEGGPFTLRKVNGAWQFDGKPDQKVNQEAVSDTLGALANLKAERYIRDKDAALDVYGLGKPKRTIEAQTGMGVKQTLHLGNAEGGSKRLYAALPGQTAVFVLSDADSARLDRDAKAYAAK